VSRVLGPTRQRLHGRRACLISSSARPGLPQRSNSLSVRRDLRPTSRALPPSGVPRRVRSWAEPPADVIRASGRSWCPCHRTVPEAAPQRHGVLPPSCFSSEQLERTHAPVLNESAIEDRPDAAPASIIPRSSDPVTLQLLLPLPFPCALARSSRFCLRETAAIRHAHGGWRAPGCGRGRVWRWPARQPWTPELGD
jgi:hypothetical protein